MKIDIVQLMSNEDASIDFDYDVTFTQNAFESMIVFEKPVHIAGTIRNAYGAILLHLAVEGNYQTQCDRCLKPIQETIETGGDFVVVTRQEQEQDENVLVASKGLLDLTDVAQNCILLALPMKHLCTQACKGLCPNCGKNLNEGPCNCSQKEIDPRLLKLKELLK